MTITLTEDGREAILAYWWRRALWPGGEFQAAFRELHAGQAVEVPGWLLPPSFRLAALERLGLGQEDTVRVDPSGELATVD